MHWRNKKMIETQDAAATILVVDDDTVIRLMLQKLMEEQKHHVVVAENGEEAVKQFQAHAPDVILMDAAMPILDGFSACAKIKTLPNGDSTPVLMITALYDDNSVDQAFAAGAIEYITKPIHLAALRHRVNTLLKARRAEIAVVKSEARFRSVFSDSAVGIALVDKQGTVLENNAALAAILERQDIKNQPFENFFAQSTHAVETNFKQQLEQGERNSYQVERHFFTADKQVRWVNMNVSLARDHNGEVQFFVYMIEDITRQKNAQLKQRMAMKVFENTNDGVMITDINGNITYVNHAFTMVTGYTYEEVLDKKASILSSGKHDSAFYQSMWDTAKITGRWQGEIWNRRKDGEVYSEWLSISVVRDDLNHITNYVGVFSDITALQGSEEHIKRLVHYDERIYRLTRYDVLTDLPNRLLFHERLTRACRDEDKLALLCIDLDGFTSLNETLGHTIGDEVLKAVGQRLQNCASDNDAVARLENDQFAIILAPLSQAHEAHVLAQDVFAALKTPLNIGEHEIPLHSHIGIGYYEGRCYTPEAAGKQVEHLIQRAELGMFMAKEAGVNTYKVYEEETADAA
jgi:diguanylate cyclase (GGDEF)-like protein/PAS domain S-box-containing protein